MTTSVLASDPPYLKAAFSVYGLSEIEGSQHEKKILAMFAASGFPQIHDDETPWCAAYLNWSQKQGGLPGTNSLMAISFARYGTPLDKTKTIPRGAIAVWSRVGGNHVNYVLSDDGTYVTCLGGNQSNNRGGGVTVSRRLKSEAVAFRMPPGAKPSTKSLATTGTITAGTVAAGGAAHKISQTGFDPLSTFLLVAGIAAVAVGIYLYVKKHKD